jgi:hypothetical protein
MRAAVVTLAGVSPPAAPGTAKQGWAAPSGHRTLARILRLAPVSLAAAAAAAAAGAAVSPAASAHVMPRMSVRGNRFYAGARPWRAWGMNWGLGDHVPVIAYFNDPSRAHLALLGTELRTARALGANSMRIYLQLDQVMATPTRPRRRTLTALRRLLALAQADGIYLDITGDLVWQPAQAPGWYARMRWPARWQVQARFWKAVAHTAAGSPAVLCYELTSEPIVAPTPDYYYGQIGDWWFVQSIATAQGPVADAMARSWTRLLAGAVRSQDDRPISIGLLPVTTGPFAPSNIADLLDMLIVHEYPTTGNAPSALSVIHSFAAFHKPLLLGETFMLTDDAPTQEAFLTAAAPYLSGAFEFFDGRDPRAVQIHTIADAIYQDSLTQFLALREDLLTSSH